MIYVLIFTWVKMAFLCKSPFDKDDGVDYDLKLGMVTNKKSILTIFVQNYYKLKLQHIFFTKK